MIIAQLSDIHADGSKQALDRLEQVIDWLRPLKPDAVIVSGDLVEVGHKTGYREVREAPLLVVPGNVDARDDMRRAFGDSITWAEEGALCGVLSLQGFRLIGLDVTVPGAHHGDARPILPWLEAELARESQPTLIFQHQHPFLCGIDGKDRNICYGGDELAGVIEAAGETVIGLTCGHVHRPMFTRFARRQATMAPSVARANRLKLDGREPSISDPPGLLVHHLQEGRLVSHVVMVS
jgi:3',5'-cyclic-AMP phosphodiesterase